jgi:hypothetical protein
MTLVRRRASSPPLGGKRVRAPSLSRRTVRCAPNLARSRQRRSPSGCPPPDEGGNHLMSDSLDEGCLSKRRISPPPNEGGNHTRHRCHQTPSDAIRRQSHTPTDRRHQTPSPSTRPCHQAASGVIRRHQASSDAITFHSAASVSNRPTINPPPSGRMYLMKETSTRHQASPGVTRRHQAPSGVIRRHQRPSAHVHEDGSSTTGHSRPTAAIGSVSK